MDNRLTKEQARTAWHNWHNAHAARLEDHLSERQRAKHKALRDRDSARDHREKLSILAAFRQVREARPRRASIVWNNSDRGAAALLKVMAETERFGEATRQQTERRLLNLDLEAIGLEAIVWA